MLKTLSLFCAQESLLVASGTLVGLGIQTKVTCVQKKCPTCCTTFPALGIVLTLMDMKVAQRDLETASRSSLKSVDSVPSTSHDLHLLWQYNLCVYSGALPQVALPEPPAPEPEITLQTSLPCYWQSPKTENSCTRNNLVYVFFPLFPGCLRLHKLFSNVSLNCLSQSV